MTNVNFKKMFVEGFGSIQNPLSFELDRGGVWLVKGRNGSGKTTLFSALSWALYRVNLKDTVNTAVGTWEEYRNEKYRGTRVIVQFETGGVDYMVVRHLDFKGTTKGLKGGSKLMVFAKTDHDRDFLDTDLVGDHLHKGDMQGYINELIGMDSKTFLNSVLFGQRMKRLVEVDNNEKRELFEKLFDLDFVQIAKDNAKEEKEKLTIQQVDVQGKIRTLGTSIDQLTTEYEKGKTLIEEFEENKAKKLTDIETKLTESSNLLKEQEKSLKSLENDLEKVSDVSNEKLKKEFEEAREEKFEVDNQIKEVSGTIRDTEREIGRAEENLVKYEQELENVEDTCPYCKNPLDAKKVSDVKAEIKKKAQAEKKVLKQLQSDLTPHTKTLQDLQENAQKQAKIVEKLQLQINQLKEKQDKIEKMKANKNSVETGIAVLKERIDGYKQQISSIKAEKPPKIDLETIRGKIIEKEDEQEQLEMTLAEADEQIELVSWWLTKGFGSGGIKAFVFNAMLSKLNAYVEKYANRLGVYVKFSVDLTKASKPFITTCYKGGKEIDYKELSGGEKQRIDIALAFAMHDLVSHQSKVNLLIMDEVFEGLDAEGIEAAFDLVRVKSGDRKTVYVISHSLVIDSLNSKLIEFQKDGEGQSIAS